MAMQKMQNIEECITELNEDLMELAGEVDALQCLLCGDMKPVEEQVRKAFLLRLLDYIHQHTQDIRVLSKYLVQRAAALR